MPAKKKMPPPRLPVLSEQALTPDQRALLDSIRSGPRGGGTGIRGPFAMFLHAPAFGELAQRLGGHCRFNSSVRTSPGAMALSGMPAPAQSCLTAVRRIQRDNARLEVA